MAKSAGLYLRISRDAAGEGLGVQRQREDCRALTERKGWTLVEEYVDNDVSATGTKPRPEYQRLLRDIREGRIDAVCVWSLDRLTRRPIEIEEFVELADDHGVALASVGGDVDISTASGRLHLRIMAAVARDEVDRKGDRQRRQRQQTAEAGLQSGGPRAFGYTADGMHLDPVEAPLLAEAYRMFLSGTSLGGIARWLTEQGTTTPRGKPWRFQSVRAVLANPRNAGVRGVRQLLPGKAGRRGARETWHTVIGPAKWPPIVEREAWEAVMVILKDPRRGERHVGNRQRYLLSGIAECGRCGAKLVTGRRDDTRVLRCPTLKHASRRADYIEEWVVAILLERLSSPKAAAAMRRPIEAPVDVSDLQTRAATLRARRDTITDMIADGEMPRGEAPRAYRRIDDQLAEIDAQLAAAMQVDRSVELSGAADPAGVWESWPLEVQRKAISRYLRVVVHSGKPGRPGGKRFDPDTVEVTWRP